MSRPRIILSRTPGAWVATFPGDAEILELFGTDTIPTPWHPNAPEEMVIEAIRAKNPDHAIEVAR